MIAEILTGSVRSGTSVLFATLGELTAERSGVINLGAEGSMLAGAYCAFAVTTWTGNPWLGIMAGASGGAFVALIHAFLVITRKANQLASGLTVMFFAFGMTAFLGRNFVNQKISSLEPIALPLLSKIPLIGPIFFINDILTFFSFILVPAVWYLLNKTRWGIILRATGENEEVTFCYGFSPTMVRYVAVLIGGVLAGLGGAQLSIAYTNTWVEGMTQGRGIVAAALVIFASWKPGRAMLGAYLFGGAQALQLVVQQKGIDISPYFLFMIPYILTLLVMFIMGRKGRNECPEELGKIFTAAKAT